MITLPNLLSACRIALTPVLLTLAVAGKGNAFLLVMIASLLTDSVDGVIARHMGQATPLGARLDTWGDFGSYTSLAIGAALLWPDILKREALFVTVAIASYGVPVLFGLIRYGRMPSHHTWAAKISAVILSGSAILMFGRITPWPFRLFTPLYILAGIEDMTITAWLPHWKPNVRSFRHALKIRREDLRRTTENTPNCPI